MKKKLLTILLAVVLVVSMIPHGVSAAESVTADEKTEINRLISQLNRLDHSEFYVTEGYSTYLISYSKGEQSLHLMMSYNDGSKFTVMRTQYDPWNPDQMIHVDYAVTIGRFGVDLVADTNITKKDYPSDENSISFTVNSSSAKLSEYDKENYKKLAATGFRLMISKLQLELVKAYKIDLKYCGFRSIKALLPLAKNEKQNTTKGTWKKDKKGWWYSYSNGKYAKNTWVKISGKWYYFNTSGYMVCGWKKIGGKWYFFGTNGTMRTAWQKIGGKWYYFGKDGMMRKNWQKISGKWYFLGSNGIMRTKWQKVNKKWYYFGTSGEMSNGWKSIGGKRYFFDDGAMVTGKKTINGVSYSFKGDGVLISSDVPTGMKNALRSANDYLKYTAFSRSKLIDQLEYEGFTTAEATYAVDICGADWNEQAAKKAQDYLDYKAFSRSELIGQLEYEGFTSEQALYGVSAVGY